MKITNADIERLSKVLLDLGKHPAGPRFVHFIVYNTGLLRVPLEAISDAREVTPGFPEYEREHQLLCIQHAERDSNGRPISSRIDTPEGPGTSYAIKDQEAFQADLRALEAEHELVRQRHMKRYTELVGLLKEEIDLPLKQVKASDFPAELLTGNVVSFFMRIGLVVWDLDEADEGNHTKD